ncbi:hypothetical protein OIU85_028836 [Salix viminalis]|uniref:Uncharacterized protein n=1 Tax=Salix viminalis TaxID=40686 RepID=A0A9Q0QA33_SALVM|nr:hypothetical protein OIU85_028836 [Salix viminalis]
MGRAESSHKALLQPLVSSQATLFVPQRGPGQIALGRRLSGVRRTQISPLIRARIHTIVEYLPAEQSQIEALPLHPASGYTVTDIPRTAGRFLPSPAPGELLLAPNHNNVHLQSLNPNNDVRFQGQPNFPNHNLTMFNQVNHRNAYRPYGPQTRQMINFMNLDHLNHSHGNDDGVVVNPKLFECLRTRWNI